jgi:hypothetical protein
LEDRAFEGVGPEAQLAALEARALDPRGAVKTGFPSLDAQLYRGGLMPGQFVALGGRMHTRKTAVAMNMAVTMLRQGVPVGFLTLDEALPMYTSKFMSILARRDSEWLEQHWQEPTVEKVREKYRKVMAGLTMTRGIRPNFTDLTEWREMASIDGQSPEVVFIDYTSLLVHYRKSETQRVVGLFEELQTWTHDQDVITVGLHQAGRTDEGISKKYHGDTPMTSEGLLYGGEQQVDILLATYRPALNQLGNMSVDQAEMILGDSFDEEKHGEAMARVRRYEKSTFLQLLKNRPSTKGLNFEGTELTSPDGSQYLEEVGEGVSDSADWKDDE